MSEPDELDIELSALGIFKIDARLNEGIWRTNAYVRTPDGFSVMTVIASRSYRAALEEIASRLRALREQQAVM